MKTDIYFSAFLGGVMGLVGIGGVVVALLSAFPGMRAFLGNPEFRTDLLIIGLMASIVSYSIFMEMYKDNNCGVSSGREGSPKVKKGIR